MTDTTTTLAPADATTLEKPATVATEANAAPETADTAETVETKDEKTEQPRGEDGKFITHPRTEKLKAQIGALTAEKRQAERELARLKSEANDLHKQLQTKVEIDPTDFDAQTAHHVSRAVKEERLGDKISQVKQIEARAEEAQQKIIEAQIEDLREQIPDIDKIFLPTDQGGPLITEIMAKGIHRSENGALVAYHLMKNPREATRIANLDPVSALVAVGQIAAGIKPNPMKRISQAPPPVQTVSGGSSKSGAVDLSTADYETYKKIRMGT